MAVSAARVHRLTRSDWVAPVAILASLLTAAPLQNPAPSLVADPAAIWVDAAGKPSLDARDALALLGDAAADGLDPADYDVATLATLSLTLDREPNGQDAADFDVGLSAALLRYLSDLHLGRVDPRTIGFKLRAPDHHHDFVAILRVAVESHRVRQAAAELTPPLAQYRNLRAMLANYRSLASDPRLVEPLPPVRGTVRPGDPFPGIASLHHRLVALGDLPAETAPPGSEIYEEPVVEAVRRFQIRHGLDSDGVLGQRTLAALQMPLAWRVRQIELSLERLRWLPDLSGGRVLTVNIPTFELAAWDAIGPTSVPSFDIGVIVGRALSTQTPVFAADLRSVIFRPYWNVPRSILIHEMLPALQRDPDYLRQHDMEIVNDEAQPLPPTAENLERLRRGELALRQRPGPTNALGLIKFVFPNDDDVYMHATPAPELFSRSRRDFSHGCVRVEDPVRLAEWVLADQPEWSRERIVAAMAGTQSFQVTLPQPVHVLLFYMTAVAGSDGAIRFADDIYGHDARLDRALVARRSAE